MTAKKHRISLRESGESFVCGEDEFIFDALRRAGCGPVTRGCCGGGCGVCKMQVVSGRVHAAKRMSRAHVSEEEQAQGVVLLCCVQPAGEVVLSSAKEGETTIETADGRKVMVY